jgi:mannosyl-oligosaccharide alpha-1,2-mannosidase
MRFYLDEYTGSYLAQKMGHLACFTGGLFALTSMYVDELSSAERHIFKSLAAEITNTCHESYIKTATHIGPESFSFKNGAEVEPIDSYYILRPEVIEAYFYMWRMTKDQKYRDWAWDAAEAIEKHCRTDSGYSGLKDVRYVNSVKDDVQQSFFFAETLKYLFLIFSDDDVLSLDKYVLNTEAHPFLILKN